MDTCLIRQMNKERSPQRCVSSSSKKNGKPYVKTQGQKPSAGAGRLPHASCKIITEQCSYLNPCHQQLEPGDWDWEDLEEDWNPSQVIKKPSRVPNTKFPVPEHLTQSSVLSSRAARGRGFTS